jgi:hypothetical protein
MAATTSSPSIIAQLFAAAGVKRVVFVDDRFGVTSERIEALANELTKEALAGCGAFPAPAFESDDEEVMRGIVVKLINAAGSADLQVMFDKLAAVQYAYVEAERDQSAALYFEKVIGTAAEIVLLSLKQWEQRKDALLAEANATPTLFIFDDDFTLEGQSTTHGRQLIGETHTANQGYKFVYALLTHNAQSDDAEISLQRDIAQQAPELEDYLLVIGKSRLSDNSDRFAERMKHLLLYRLFRVLTRRLRDETAQASELAIKQINDLGVQSFERIILGTSRAEGAWSPDTLVRVIGVYQQQQIKQNIRKDPKLHELVRDINPICDVGTSVMTDGVTTAAKRLQHDEIYESGELINAVHLPLASGDIFGDGKGQQYILLAQPCDLVVRSTGLRRSKDRDSRQMVPLAPLRKVESKYSGISLPSEQYELPHFTDEDRWSVRLSETYYLPVWLLDLVVLNDDGRCSLIASQEPSPLLIDPWRKRLTVLNQRVAAIASSANKITDASIDRAELLQSYCRIPLGAPFEVQLTQEQNGAEANWRLTIGLARTTRVTELHSTAVLIEYAAYLARLAHPHDLTRLDSK